MSWAPSTDFEEEIVSLQENHNFIFGALSEPEPEVFYPRPKSHVDFVAKQRKLKQETLALDSKSGNPKLNIIAEVQRITGSKPLGELPTIDDWNTNDNIVEETVAMMRHFGLGPSIERALDEKRTLPTLPLENGIYVANQRSRRRMPIIFDDNFFKWDVDDYKMPANVDDYDHDHAYIGEVSTFSDSSLSSMSKSCSTENDNAAMEAHTKSKRLPRNTEVSYEPLLGVTNCPSNVTLLSDLSLGGIDSVSSSGETPSRSENFNISQTRNSSSHKKNTNTQQQTNNPKNHDHENSCKVTSSQFYNSSFPPLPQRYYTPKELHHKKRANRN